MTTTLTPPQIAWITILILEFVGGVYLHGRPREPLDVRYFVIGLAIQNAILWWGGFFG